MKYLVSFRERPCGSVAEYEAAQERALVLFDGFKMPSNLTVHQFLGRVGEFGGYIIVETDDASGLHTLGSIFAMFDVKVEPVLDIQNAIGIEIQGIAFRRQAA